MIRAQKKLQSIYSALRKEICEGAWMKGEKLPNETQLAKRFDCSLGTVSKAMSLLAHEGLVVRKARAGTTVVRNSDEPVANSTQLDAFAFIYPSEKHEGIRRTVAGFQDAAQENGRRTLTLTTGTDYRKEAELIARLKEFDVKGAVIYSIIQNPEDQVYVSQILSRTAFPIVLACINLPGMDLPAAFFDDFHAGYTMTKYLLGKGLRKIGFLSSSRAPDGCHGYQWALKEAGVAPMPELVLMEQGMRADFQNFLGEPVERAEEYLRARSGLEAVVCGHDFLALGVIEAAQRIGLRVPKDLKVTGIDDYGMSATAPVPLTTYHVPYEEIGKAAFQLLSEKVATGTVPLLERRLTGHLVVRKSS